MMIRTGNEEKNDDEYVEIVWERQSLSSSSSLGIEEKTDTEKKKKINSHLAKRQTEIISIRRMFLFRLWSSIPSHEFRLFLPLFPEEKRSIGWIVHFQFI